MKSINLNNVEPKILVISNNPFSEISNNGKTLASFFDEFSPDNIAQIYFSDDIPSGTLVRNFYRITDTDIIKSIIINKHFKCGCKIYVSSNLETCNSKKKSIFLKIIKQSNFVRLIREMLWSLGRWNSTEFCDWLDKFSPDIIFFCAGDSGFAYNICNFIHKRYNSKLVIYITDDYVLPRKTFNPIWWIRRNYILYKMKFIINKCDLFITISQKMRKVYKDLFGKDSIIAVNMTEPMKNYRNEKGIDSINSIILVYTGGLHYNRYKTLNLLAKNIKRYNEQKENKRKAVLKIYSGQEVDKKILKYLNIHGASEFCGKLNKKQLKEVLNQSDILVHVESFDRKSIESTRLSISTKIPEYLSLGKPILAIGPNEIASMEYLVDTAFCITNRKYMYHYLEKFLNDDELRSNLSKRAFIKYQKNHNKEVQQLRFKSNILNLVNN